MSELFLNTLQHFFIPIVATAYFLLFLFANHNLPSDIHKRFRMAGCCVLLLIAADSVQYYCEGLDYVTPVRMWAAAFGYVCRPSILYYILMIFLRKRSNLHRSLLSIPVLLTAICSFAAFFTEKAFYYTPDNVLVRGPLVIMPFIASIFYYIFMLCESIRNIRLGNPRETVLLLFVLFFASLSTYLEAVQRFAGLLSGICIVGIILYLLFFMVDSYMHDHLTNAYRRERLYQDFERLQNSFGVIILDLNDLKVINDRLGHAEGDKAIITVCRAAEDCLSKKARIYRIGGDEFAILVKAGTALEVKALEQKIRTTLAGTGYSMAVGSAFGEENESLETIMSRADQVMYREKRRMKGQEIPAEE